MSTAQARTRARMVFLFSRTTRSGGSSLASAVLMTRSADRFRHERTPVYGSGVAVNQLG